MSEKNEQNLKDSIRVARHCWFQLLRGTIAGLLLYRFPDPCIPLSLEDVCNSDVSTEDDLARLHNMNLIWFDVVQKSLQTCKNVVLSSVTERYLNKHLLSW